MVIDFKKLGGENGADTELDPREIFVALPAKGSRYSYPRDVQGQVWEAWFKRRDEKDLVIKMNTGAGKTVVGLLLLKSCLNEGVGPALYVAPDNYLAAQVRNEAAALGIAVTDEVRSADFLRGRSIGVVNIHKLVNGRSVFGVADDGVKIRIGSVIVDDAHACLATTEDQFTITAVAGSPIYDELLQLFRGSLQGQGHARFLEVEGRVPGTNLLVPFWDWKAKQAEIAAILHGHRDLAETRFRFPLLRDILPLCSCSFGGDTVEITTRCIPIDVIPSFADARRRVYMTATLADDGVLVTHFDAPASAARQPITPVSASDLGERMILIPQELNPELTDDELRTLVYGVSKDYNVVVIVPSWRQSEPWERFAGRTVGAEDLIRTVEDLKSGHVGLITLVNKYDGVDLPDAACRLLVLDGLPDVRRKLDRIDGVMLRDTDLQLTMLLQRLEQGMGRGTRSADDHCAVVLMGRSLVGRLHQPGAAPRFSPGTRAQLDLSTRLAEQLEGADATMIREAIDLLLRRDPEWVRAARGAMVGAKYSPRGTVGAIAEAQRNAFAAARRHDHSGAITTLQDAVNAETHERTRGWLRMQLAERVNDIDPAQAQQILQTAASENPAVPTPLAGIQYRKLKAHSGQADACVKAISKWATPTELMVQVNYVLDRLRYAPDTAGPFEDAVQVLGSMLGFAAQAPESEFGSGPDALWVVGPAEYFVIECKNGVVSGFISKSDANQLGGSVRWLEEHYGESLNSTPIVFHPDRVAGPGAVLPSGTRVVDREKLPVLIGAVRDFFTAVSAGAWPPDVAQVEDRLTFHKLSAAGWAAAFTRPGRSGDAGPRT
jgi:hypothetical protein